MEDPATGRRRTLPMVLARHVARVRSRRTLFSGLARAVLVTVVAAVAALPLAAVWGIAQADVDDYLGPHRVNFASSFSGEVEIDLGPIGNAYLTSPVRPIGLTITVGGVGSAAGTLNRPLLRTDAGRVRRPLRRARGGRRGHRRAPRSGCGAAGIPCRSRSGAGLRIVQAARSVARTMGGPAPDPAPDGGRVPGGPRPDRRLDPGAQGTPRVCGSRLILVPAAGSTPSRWTACCWPTCWIVASKASSC